METFRFVFWEALKTLSLVLVALLAVKSISGSRPAAAGSNRACAWIRGALYALTLALGVLGARGIGKDLAARFYYWGCQDDVARLETSGSPAGLATAYAKGRRAVELRPGELKYWRALSRSKFVERQFASMLADQPAFEALSDGHLEEEDALRFAFAHLFLAQYDQVIPLTQQLIRENRFYAEPYVVEGTAYLDQKKYREAEQTFLEVLQIFPTQEDAVRGLARVYWVSGDRARALKVLDETSKFPFSPEARQRFLDLKELYSEPASAPASGAGSRVRKVPNA
ncbi:MAG TPA: tetratricopeptide repeat protein [Terriglobia bacterium]|nr:tetratricopeptide repeat protein [Terriglobia bacterium]